MPRVKLTKRFIDSLVPGPINVLYADSDTPGFMLKLTPSGRRIYYAYYRNAVGQRRRPKIGAHGILTLDQARDIARQWIGEASAGGDPSFARQQARKRMTVAELWTRYRKDASARWKPRTCELHDHVWKRDLEPRFARHTLEKVTRREVTEMHQALVDTPTRANRAVMLLKAMFNAARDWELTTADNPAARVKFYRTEKREVFLSAPQLRALMAAIDEEEKAWGKPSRTRTGEAEKGIRGGKGKKETESRGISTHCAGLFRLLVYTGARRDEIRTLQWPDVNWDSESLRIDSKTGRKTIWLNSLALAELKRLHTVRTQDVYVIEGRRPGTVLENAQKAWRRVRDRAEIPQVRLHDLRHSFASFGVLAGVLLQVTGKLLGHSEARTTERYAHLADDPVRLASETIAEHIRKAMEEGEK